MNVMSGLRVYHGVLAVLSLLSYMTGEIGLIHAWLGYGVALVILFRLLWAIAMPKQMGLSRFSPQFSSMTSNNFLTHPALSKALMLGVAVSVVLASMSGILMDDGRAIGLAQLDFITPSFADDDGYDGSDGREKNEMLEEFHEFSANLMLLMVGMHVTYLLLFRLPMAKFMLFLKEKKKG